MGSKHSKTDVGLGQRFSRNFLEILKKLISQKIWKLRFFDPWKVKGTTTRTTVESLKTGRVSQNTVTFDTDDLDIDHGVSIDNYSKGSLGSSRDSPGIEALNRIPSIKSNSSYVSNKSNVSNKSQKKRKSRKPEDLR